MHIIFIYNGKYSLIDYVKNVVKNMNVVLTQIVPGLTIGVKDLGSELFPNGMAGAKIQLVSHKNNKEIPLRYESEGIKKIVSTTNFTTK